MFIVYHCVGGTHSSAIAAGIHLNMLPIDSKPSYKDIKEFPFFDTLTKENQGKIILRGKDSQGNKVFTLSRQFVPQLVIPAVKDSFILGGGDLNNLLLVDTMSAVNTLMKIGGFSSRRLNLVSLGRPIVTKGTLQAYNDIIKIVKETKGKLINY